MSCAELAEEARLCAEVDAAWDEVLKMNAKDDNVALDPIDELLAFL